MLDLDGTTIPGKTKAMPSARVKDAIEKASKKLHVGVVTGRPLFITKHLLSHLAITAPSIVNGGAQIIDPKTNDIIWKKLIPSSEVRGILSVLEKYNKEILVQSTDVPDDDVFYKPSQEVSNVLTIQLVDIPLEQGDEIIEQLKQFKDVAIHRMFGWEKGTEWLQICHAEATKQHGIWEVAKLLGIETHEIIGVGDGYNDFPLLMACGLKVAMGNAVPELKAIADYIAPTVDDDGVADVIEKYIL